MGYLNKKEIPGNLTYNKTDKLKSRKLIDQLFKQEQSFSIFPFRVLYMNSCEPGSFLRAGFGVSSKKFKKAVDRNAIKRLMREAYRLQKIDLGLELKGINKGLAIFVVYTGNEIPAYSQVFDKMSLVILRLLTFVHEDASTNP